MTQTAIAKPVRTLKVKKSCCKSGPRCKRCPVVLKRLEDMGWAQRTGKREYVAAAKPPKAVVRAARARRDP